MKRFLTSATASAAFMLSASVTLGRERGAIAVLAAMDSELSALKKEAEIVGGSFEFDGRTVYQARCEGRPVLLAKTGATPEAARAITQWLVREREVSAVVSLGTAGSLNEGLQIGEVVVARNALRDGNGQTTPWNLQEVTGCQAKSANMIVTVKAFVANGSERARLRETYGADMVDMSAAEIAEICATRHIPCVIIREISDRADEDAPRAFVETYRRKRPEAIQAAVCAVRQLKLDKASDEHQ